MGEAPPRIPATAATRKAVETVRMVIMHQQKYWRCLYPKDLSRGTRCFQDAPTLLMLVDFDDFIEAEKLHGKRAYDAS